MKSFIKKMNPSLLAIVAFFVSSAGVWGQLSNGVLNTTPVLNATFTVPCGVTSITVQVWGGGGGGAGDNANNGISTGYGGGGGGYTTTTLSVTPGSTITYTIGAGGTSNSGAAGGNGVNSNFGSVTANGGNGGTLTAPGTGGGGSIGLGSGGSNTIGSSGGSVSGGVSGAAGGNSGSGSGFGSAGTTDGAQGGNATAVGGGGGGSGDRDGGDEAGGTGFNGGIRLTWTVGTLPTVNAGAAQTICVGTSVTLAGSFGGSATGATWSAPSGTFGSTTAMNTTYTPSITPGSVTLTLTNNSASGTGTCAVTSTVVITVVAVPTVNASSDQSVCSGGSITLAGTRGGSATSSTWSAPSGSFSAATSLNSTYTPSITSGTVTLTLTSNDPDGGGSSCSSATDQMIVTVFPAATANAGVDRSICAGQSLSLAGSFGGSATSATWSGASGTFSPTTGTMNATYTPTITSGSITLTLTTNDPAGICPAASDQMVITVSQAVDGCACAGQLSLNELGISGSLGTASVGLEPGESVCTPNAGYTSDNQTHWYSFTASEVCQAITVAPTNNICAGMLKAALYSGSCGSMTQIECKTAGSGGGAQLYFNRCDFVVGQTYYVQLAQYSDNGCNNNVDYIIAWQTVDNDMCSARQICDATTSLVSYNTGSGAADINAVNDGCMTYGERAPNWFVFQADQTGTLTLTIDVQGSGDFDYAIWGPYNQLQNNCSTVNGPTTAPIRCSVCSSANNMTLSTSSTDVSEGANSCDNSLAALNVTAGQIYYLLINNWQYSPDAFTLTWGGLSTTCEAIIPLPIELASFTGHNQGRENLLLWTTFSEINNEFFTLERSRDGINNWEVVGIVQGALNSQEKIDYSYVDKSPYEQITYYRLTQTDTDGSTETSDVISVASSLEIHGLLSQVYPNPSDKDFYFVYGGKNLNSPLTIEVINHLGNVISTREVTEFNLSQAIEVGASELSKGIYYLKVSQEDKFDLRKLTKQ